MDDSEEKAFAVGQVWRTREGEVRWAVAIDPANWRGSVLTVCAGWHSAYNYANGKRWPHGEIAPEDLIEYLFDFPVMNPFQPPEPSERTPGRSLTPAQWAVIVLVVIVVVRLLNWLAVQWR